jgi:DNA-binding transcriptional ArsR family regulator
LFDHLMKYALGVRETSLIERARVFAALADPTRLGLLEILAGEEELCGTQLARRAGISTALLSHHWKVLADAGVVKRERRGQRLYCTLDRDVLEIAFEKVWPSRRVRTPLSLSRVS